MHKEVRRPGGLAQLVLQPGHLKDRRRRPSRPCSRRGAAALGLRTERFGTSTGSPFHSQGRLRLQRRGAVREMRVRPSYAQGPWPVPAWGHCWI